MPHPFRTAVLGGALLLAAGCTADDAPGQDPQTDQAVEVDLVDLLNESARIEADLDAAENRIIRACLETQGFTAHDEEEMATPDPLELEDLAGGVYPHDASFPDPEGAAEYGFGVWAESEEAMESGEAEDYQQTEGEWVDAPDPVDNAAFLALPEDERRAWYVAYVGEEKAAGYNWKFTSDGDELSGAVLFSDDEMDALHAEPGGCELAMIEAVYGEPELIEPEHEDEGFDRWVYRPENPVHGADVLATVETAYAEAMVDAQAAFVGCLAERGHPGWEFTESGGLPVWEYFAPLYMDEELLEESDTGAEAPVLPADLPDDYEGRRAYETAVAVDFTECDAETGYTETSTKTYDAAHVDLYTTIEQDLFAWQEEMREALERAQEVIGG
jgi:hypothetical protein